MTDARVDDPDVSIIVRTKDRPDYLRRALADIAAQTLASWECIIVNDGGDPETVAGLVAARDDAFRARTTVIDSPESRGRWRSANAGVLASRAALLVLHDDDDTWDADFLQRATDYLDAHPTRAGVVSRIEIVWETREGDRFSEERREVFQEHLTAPSLSDTLLFNRFVPIGFVYRRWLHEEHGLYDDSLPVVGDWAFNMKVLTHEELEYLPGAPAVQWRQRTGSSGADGNSVIDSGDLHRAVDARLRDAALREYVQANGTGLVLYLTKFIDQRFVDVENGVRGHLSDVEARLRHDLGPRGLLRAVARRIRRR
ncbi:glycosyltransferase family 2 protein [Microbacterium sp. 1P06AB]|uniref:glycosyltransferase family 2 protein n=1 Tax=Microbacterium sp. 1P06AB TaxID=3132289 RepID=UPI0039A680EA